MFASKKDLALEVKRLLVAAERRPGGPGRLKRATLARMLGVSPSSLYAYLDGTTLPQADVLDRLLDVLDVDSAQRQQLVEARDALDPSHSSTPGVAPRLVPFQLPSDVFGFTSRDAELARLDELLADGSGAAVVILAVDGMAGVGKTALAVHWAHRVRDRFTDGQLYLNMRGYAPNPPLPPLEALARLLHTLGFPTERVPADVDAAASIYRSLLADKRILLVLDNAASAEQVRPLLPGGGGSAVVVTSRDQLGGLVARDGAHRLHLDVLPPRDAHALLTRILGARVDETEHGALTELAELCGHLPLALRIAAANLLTRPHQRITDYLAHLRAGDRLTALAVAGDTASAVSVSFDLSYRHLPTATRRMFRLLGLVPGPDVTAEAAAALADLDTTQAGGLLDELARAHLLEEHAAGRYICHDLLRHYAVNLAAREETALDRDAARSRLYAYYLTTADAAARMLYPAKARLPVDTHNGYEFPDHDHALTWLEDELPCLVAAVNDAGENGPRVTAWLLADTLRGYFWLSRTVSDWLAVGNAALAAAQTAGDPDAEAAAWLSVGDVNQVQGRYQQAIDAYQRVRRIGRAVGAPRIRTAALNNLGEINWRRGRPREAADCYERVLAFERQTGVPGGEALQLGNLGFVYRTMGRLEQAADFLTRALAASSRDGHQHLAAVATQELGETHHLLGRFGSAHDLLTQALSDLRQLGDRASEAAGQQYLAALHRDRGEPAIDLARTSLALAREVRDSHIEADALNCLATIHHQLGQHHEAVEHHQQALQTANDADLRYPQAEALLGLAAAHHHLGDHQHAHDLLHQATTIINEAGFRLLEAQTLTLLAELHLTEGNTSDATTTGEHALNLHRETGHRLGEARTHLLLGHAHQRARAPRAAHDHWSRAHAVFADIGTPDADHLATLLSHNRLNHQD